MLWKIAVLVFIAGCVGGSVTGLVALAGSSKNGDNGESNGNKSGKGRERGLSRFGRWGFTYKNPGCYTVFAGLAGNVLLGGLAAVVNWGLYGPFSGFAIVGAAPAGGSLIEPFLTVGQLTVSIVLGIGGSAFLQAESQVRCKERFLAAAYSLPTTGGQPSGDIPTPHTGV
jgi:hypothetical protein